MKQKLLLSCLLLAGTMAGQAQDEVKLEDIKVPVSPAFSILDLSPKSIETPGTIKAFTANIATMAAKAAGIPRNFAFEFSPYWFFKHPKMDIYKYYGLGTNSDTSSFVLKPNIFYGLRSTSVSLGSVFKDSSKALPVDVNYIAYAIRANVINVRNRKVLNKLSESIVNVNEALGNILAQAVLSPECGALDGEERRACIAKKIQNSKDSSFKANREAFNKYLTARPIFSADLAFASSTAFGDNRFSNSKTYRTGGWVTLAYNQPLVSKAKVQEDIDNLLQCKNYINAYFMFRFLEENNTKDFKAFAKQSLVDLGGRLEMEFNKFSFSVEAIKRINSDDKDQNTSRTVGIVQYKISDDLYLLGTFGKDFGEINNIVTLLGLNWGFGENALNKPFKN